MGTLPATQLLLTRNDIVVGHFSKYVEIAYFIGISIDDYGVITFNGKKVNPTYNLEPSIHTGRDGWNKHEAIADWARYHMRLPSGYRTYRYLVGG